MMRTAGFVCKDIVDDHAETKLGSQRQNNAQSIPQKRDRDFSNLDGSLH